MCHEDDYEHRCDGQLPNLVVPETFDDPLPADELSAWESALIQ